MIAMILAGLIISVPVCLGLAFLSEHVNDLTNDLYDNLKNMRKGKPEVYTGKKAGGGAGLSCGVCGGHGHSGHGHGGHGCCGHGHGGHGHGCGGHGW